MGHPDARAYIERSRGAASRDQERRELRYDIAYGVAWGLFKFCLWLFIALVAFALLYGLVAMLHARYG